MLINLPERKIIIEEFSENNSGLPTGDTLIDHLKEPLGMNLTEAKFKDDESLAAAGEGLYEGHRATVKVEIFPAPDGVLGARVRIGVDDGKKSGMNSEVSSWSSSRETSVDLSGWKLNATIIKCQAPKLI